MRIFILCIILPNLLFAAVKNSTSTVGVWNPAGDPAINDDVIISHDWSSGWAMGGGLANGFTGTLLINDGGYFHGTNSLDNFAGTMTVSDGGIIEIDGNITNLTGAIVVDDGGVLRGNSNFNGGDDLLGASVRINGSLYLPAPFPNGVVTLDLVVSGTGNIDADRILLTGNGSTGTTVLPVQLISFDLKKEPTNIILHWKTASEINNDYFDIEKSIDGINFVAIGRVFGNGNSSEINKYLFKDYVLQNKNVYYRLKQVDYDGAYQYSNIISTLGYSKPLEIIQKRFTNEFYVILEKSTHIEIIAYDYNGKLIYRKTCNNTGLRFNFTLQEIGNYFIIVRANSTVVHKKATIF
jgi:hypothetical protein